MQCSFRSCTNTHTAESDNTIKCACTRLTKEQVDHIWAKAVHITKQRANVVGKSPNDLIAIHSNILCLHSIINIIPVHHNLSSREYSNDHLMLCHGIIALALNNITFPCEILPTESHKKLSMYTVYANTRTACPVSLTCVLYTQVYHVHWMLNCPYTHPAGGHHTLYILHAQAMYAGPFCVHGSQEERG